MSEELQKTTEVKMHAEERDYILIRPTECDPWLTLGPAVASTWADVLGELKALREEDAFSREPGAMLIRVQAMTGEQVNALDEFRGW